MSSILSIQHKALNKKNPSKKIQINSLSRVLIDRKARTLLRNNYRNILHNNSLNSTKTKRK